MGSSKKGKSVTVGYRYLMGVQLALSHGPVDAIRRIIIGEREAWGGSVTDNTTVYINKPDLFGGDNREGGVKGNVDILMGGPAQARNSYLATHQGANCPAYRGIVSVLFKSFMWASGNPYFKTPWVEATRVLKGWQGDTPWNPADAYIGTLDMNPAHIVCQCLTDPAWGMGYSLSDIGTSFTSAAAQLKSEGFGLSLPWDQQSSIEDFVKIILNHINGTLGLSMVTGKFELRLIRDDYNPADLITLDESNVLELKSFQRAAFGDSANEVVVGYTDRDGNAKTVAVQDLASVSAQGGVISTTREYPGIRDSDLAAKVAMRDLKTLSAPLAQVSAITNRVLWDKEIGDVVKMNWSSLGMSGVVFRIIEISKGTLTEGAIEVKMVEDVFGLPANSYTSTPPTQWVDTVVPPVVADAARAVEAPYWNVVRNASLADMDHFEPGYGFGLFFAGRGSVQSTLAYVLSASSDNVAYSDVSTGNFNPTGTLAGTLDRTATTFYLSGAYDMDSIVLAEDGGYCVIDNECMSVLDFDPDTGYVEVGRGILDTVPATHTVGTRAFFMTQNTALDTTERVSGETVYYKPRPQTGIGTLALDDATAETLVFGNRASRPYPPGNVRVDGQVYPVTITGPGVTVTWAHRDRVAQTVEFVDYTAGNIGPEPGTTYVLRLYSGATLLHEYELSGDTTAWQYPEDHDTADGHLATLRFKLSSKRDGLESLQAVDHSFQRSVVNGNVGIETPPGTPVLTATNGYFSIDLTWVWGDLRTNIEKLELRVADVPDFNKSTVLQYVNYPDQQYTHEIGTVRAFKWYWARAIDTDGQMSAWSNMASARALASSPAETLDEINNLLTDGSGTAKIEMIADRFSIVAPDGSKTPFAVVEKSPGQWATLLNSDVLIGGNVDIANLNTGALPNDVMMRLGGGVIELDGSGEIRVFKDLQPNADFVRLSSGEIRFLRYIGGTYQTYNYLSRLETGVANNGVEVTIPGYWKAQPRVMVSPAILSFYKATYANQDQGISCTAQNIVETVPGSGVWKFTPVATLNLAAASGGGAINLGSGDISANTYTSASQTTPANCVNITPSLSLKSNRGTGSSQYYRRTVRWRVEYFNGGSWVQGAWRMVSMGDQLNPVVDSFQFSFPSAGTWQWRIAYEAYDTDGTVFGAMSYTYQQQTVSATSGALWAQAPGVNPYDPPDRAITITLPNHSLSGEVYQVDYSWSCKTKGIFSATGTSVYGVFYDFGRTAYGAAHNISYDYIYTGGNPATYETPPNSWSGSFTHSGSNLTFDTTVHSRLLRNGPNDTPYKPPLSVYDINISATVRTRTPVANSTTPVNNFLLSSYTYNLTTAQVLATGSLNWMAVGE